MNVYNQIMGLHLPNTRQITLRSLIPGQIRAIKKDLLRFLIAAARLVIPRHWRSSQPPTLVKWYAKVEQLRRMENIISDIELTTDNYIANWSGWLTYTQS